MCNYNEDSLTFSHGLVTVRCIVIGLYSEVSQTITLATPSAPAPN